jgi:regulator of sigma E protease
VPVVMGPLFNLFLGIIIFFAMNLVGYERESNRVYLVDEFDSVKKTGYVAPARKGGIQSGDVIVAINNAPIHQFSDIQKTVFFSDGSALAVKVRRGNDLVDAQVVPELAERGRYSIGVMPFVRGARVSRIVAGSAAAKAGLHPGDIIVRVDDRLVRIPEDFVTQVKAKKGQEITISVERNGRIETLKATPHEKEKISVQLVENARLKGKGQALELDNRTIEKIKEGIAAGTVTIDDAPVREYAAFVQELQKVQGRVATVKIGNEAITGIFSYESFGFMGVETGQAQDMVMVRYGVGESFVRAFTEPYGFIVMNLKGLGMLFTGKLNVRENLSGPIFIAKIAGDVAYYRGIAPFIILMAQISIILMIMNLLPIPMVDGSYVIIFLIEAIRKKPLSTKTMERIQYFGMAFLIILGVFIIFNDIMKLFFM